MYSRKIKCCVLSVFIAYFFINSSFSQNNYYEYTKVTTLDIHHYSGWYLSSLPEKQPVLFPESMLTDSIGFGFNRAKICWYSIDPLFLRNNSATPTHIKENPDFQSNHFVREIFEKEIFPDSEHPNNIPTNISVLNLAYYPQEKGPYNYDINQTTFSSGIDSNGLLLNPKSRWAGIMREIETPDFERASIKTIEFWLMDPFVYDTIHSGGEMYINLGDISEDILKDSWLSFENSPKDTTSIWGNVSTITPGLYIDNNNPYRFSDCGLDGFPDFSERQFFSYPNYINSKYSYLISILNSYGSQSLAYQNAIQDPSNDNYHHFRGSDYDQLHLGIIERYKKFNLLEGNSTSERIASILPDFEDINKNFELEVAENYFQYQIHIKPDSFIIGHNYIDDTISYNATFKNGTKNWLTWFHFTIPIESFQKRFGQISSFKKIKFIRIFLKNFEDSIIMRLATLDLVRKADYKYIIPNDIEANKLYIYPNPSNGNFTIYLSDIECHIIDLYNLDGQRIDIDNIKSTDSMGPKFINIKNLNKGIYIIKVISVDNKVFTSKILIL